jgi:Putative transmembrane protein (PGPGW)
LNQKSQRSLRFRLRKILHLEDAPPLVRRVIIAVIGGTIILIGLAMIVLPGPAIVVIPLGLAVLATEFIWARLWLRRARRIFKQARDRVTGSSNK